MYAEIFATQLVVILKFNPRITTIMTLELLNTSIFFIKNTKIDKI